MPSILEILAMGAFFSFAYPPAAAVRVFISGSGGGLPVLVAALLFMPAGAMTAVMLPRIKHLASRIAAAVPAVALPALTAILLHQGTASGKIFYDAFLFFFFFGIGIFIGTGRGQNSFYSMLPSAGTIVLTCTLLATYVFSKISNLRWVFFFSAYTFILFAILVKRKEILNLVFVRRGVEQPEVRCKIERRSILSAFTVYAAVILLFNLKGIVIFILGILNAAAGKIFRFIIWVIGLLFRHKSGTATDYFGFMPFDPRPSGAPLAVFLLYFTIYSLLFLILYWILPRIFKYMKELYHEVYSFLRRLLANNERIVQYSPDEYIDITETDREAGAQKGQALRKPSLNELHAALKNTADPVLRLRLQYRIVLTVLKLRNYDIQSSDSTGDVCRKTAAAGALPEGLPELTVIYDAIRYGGKIPAEYDIRIADESFEKLV